MQPSLVAIAALAVWVPASSVRGQEGTDPHTLLRTVAAALTAREANVPPLAMCGVYRGFYTDLHWAVWNEVLAEIGDQHRYDPKTAGDRAAVAVGVWEAFDRRSWQREYQGLYRGPNNWIWPTVQVESGMLADMHRIEYGAADRVTALDFVGGYPVLTVKRPGPGRPYAPFALFLGLASPRTSLGGEYKRVFDDRAWVQAPPQREGDLLTVSAARADLGEKGIEEQVLEVDAAHGFTPVRYRVVRLRQGHGGTAHEIRWADCTNLGQLEELWLPTSVAHWEFSYAHPDLGALRRTEVFNCLALRENDTEVLDYGPPRLALLDRLDSDMGLLGNLEESWGAKARASVRDFVHETPPEPPGDLLGLDPEAAAEDIRKRYGVP